MRRSHVTQSNGVVVRKSSIRKLPNRSQRTSKCGENISDTLGCASCATFLFLPHFDFVCDLLLKRGTATWNLFVKPWSNGLASSRKLKTWVYLRLRLARPCVHLRWLAMTSDHFGRDQICTQVKASFSPFGHPIQVSSQQQLFHSRLFDMRWL